ncbi:VWA domain-containing protein [Agrobacterium salinitolerans]|nr:VWA domain-containing protein [Agrobacterium salinitolerans]
MSVLTPGANASVPSPQLSASITLQQVPGIDVDVSAFLLKADGKVRNDEDMIFYGQPSAASGKVSFVGSANGRSEFKFDLASLDAAVEKIALTATIHENKTRFASFSDIQIDLGGLKATVPTAGKTETALILGELYRRNGEWKFRCLGQGFEGGLAPLATNFGVVVDEAAPAQAAPPARARVSLEKKVEAKAPQLVSLAKKVQVTLEKKSLTEVVAQVALVLDASGSMNGQYSKGRVQELINRVVPLAVHFDRNEELECWAFAEKPQQLSSVTLDNFNGFIDRDNKGWRSWNVGARVNEEPAVIRKVIDFYKKSGDRTPIYVLFVSDGGVYKNAEITALMKEAASLPIFWQFVGIGGRGYGILEKLDTMKGRVVDNCGFFAIDDLHSLTEEALYDRLMEEFPLWLKAARAANIIL